MVAVLEAPPRARTAAERRAAARIVPLRLVPDYGTGNPGVAERVRVALAADQREPARLDGKQFTDALGTAEQIATLVREYADRPK